MTALQHTAETYLLLQTAFAVAISDVWGTAEVLVEEVLCNLQYFSSLLTAFKTVTAYCHGCEQNQLDIRKNALRLTIVLPVGSPVSLAILLILWDLMLYM